MLRKIFTLASVFVYEALHFGEGRGLKRQGEARDRNGRAGTGKAHELVIVHAMQQAIGTARLKGIAGTESALYFDGEGLPSMKFAPLSSIEHFAAALGQNGETFRFLHQLFHDGLGGLTLIMLRGAFLRNDVDGCLAV